MEWIVEAETREDLVDGQMVICEEIVRCKDCTYYIAKYEQCDCAHWDTSQGYQLPEVYEDDYCSYGERRIDAAD